VFVEVEGGQYQDPGHGVGGLGEDAFGGLDAVHAGHADVHQDHLGGGLGGERHGLLAAAGLADHVDAGCGVQQAHQAGPYEVLVVHDEHGCHVVVPSPRLAARAEVGR